MRGVRGCAFCIEEGEEEEEEGEGERDLRPRGVVVGVPSLPRVRGVLVEERGVVSEGFDSNRVDICSE